MGSANFVPQHEQNVSRQHNPATKVTPLAPQKGLLADRSVSEVVCIEMGAGSARLSFELKTVGFNVIPIDCARNRHSPKVKCVIIDLTTSAGKDLLFDMLRSPTLLYVHSAPPCGTGSRAREKRIPEFLRQQGAPDPQPLRSNSHPRGLPSLAGISLTKVQCANAFYDLTAEVFAYCKSNNIMCTVENPRNAYIVGHCTI